MYIITFPHQFILFPRVFLGERIPSSQLNGATCKLGEAAPGIRGGASCELSRCDQNNFTLANRLLLCGRGISAAGSGLRAFIRDSFVLPKDGVPQARAVLVLLLEEGVRQARPALGSLRVGVFSAPSIFLLSLTCKVDMVAGVPNCESDDFLVVICRRLFAPGL